MNYILLLPFKRNILFKKYQHILGIIRKLKIFLGFEFFIKCESMKIIGMYLLQFWAANFEMQAIFLSRVSLTYWREKYAPQKKTRKRLWIELNRKKEG